MKQIRIWTLALALLPAVGFAQNSGPVPVSPEPRENQSVPNSAPESAPAQPKEETLRDVRQAVAQGKLKGVPELCDRVRAGYEQLQAVHLAQPDGKSRAALDTYMACFCLYAKAQALALLNDLEAARAALSEAQAYQQKSPIFRNSRVLPLLQTLTILGNGLIQERSGHSDRALQTYLPATYSSGEESHVVTGRLAMIELERGHVDKAQSWAYIHADDPTSQLVLARIALQKKNPLLAQKHATTALGLLNQELKSGQEYIPLFYAEAPAIRALSKKLPPLPKPPPPPKPAAQPQPANPPPLSPPPAPPLAPSAAAPMKQ